MGTIFFSFRDATEEDHAKLLELWELSVRQTHDFLREEDIIFYKKVIGEHQVFDHVRLVCANDVKDKIIGFLGVSTDNIEMLFLDPEFIGMGIGKGLLLYAINKLGMRKVDVNEHNSQARAFYEHFGFKVMSRSELDGTGKPYPILHMEL